MVSITIAYKAISRDITHHMLFVNMGKNTPPQLSQ